MSGDVLGCHNLGGRVLLASSRWRPGMPLGTRRHAGLHPVTGTIWSQNPCSGMKKLLTVGVRPSFWVVGRSLGIAQPPKISFDRPPPYLMFHAEGL